MIYPQIRLLYIITSNVAAIGLSFNLHCKANSCLVLYSVWLGCAQQSIATFTKAAISLSFNLHCKANSCLVLYSVSLSYLRTLPQFQGAILNTHMYNFLFSFHDPGSVRDQWKWWYNHHSSLAEGIA